MSTFVQDKIKLTGNGVLMFNDDDNLSLYSNNTNQLTVAATNAAGRILVTSGTGGLALDSTYGSSTTGTVLGGINLTSAAASSWVNSSSNLTLETRTSGNIAWSSAGGVNVTSNTASIWNQASSSLTLQTTGLAADSPMNLTSSGIINLTSSGISAWQNTGALSLTTTGNLTLTSGNSIIANSSGALTLSSAQPSSWAVSNSLSLQATGTSGTISLLSAGATSITSTGVLTLDSSASINFGRSATAISIGSSGMTTTIEGDLVVVGTSDTQINAQSQVLSSTDVGVYDAGVLTSGALRASGGLATLSNILANADGTTVGGPVLNITQNNITAEQPVGYLEQSCDTQSFLSLVGSSNNLQAGYTIVRSSALVTFTSEAYVQMTLQDNGKQNPLNGGLPATYYLPLYSIS